MFTAIIMQNVAIYHYCKVSDLTLSLHSADRTSLAVPPREVDFVPRGGRICRGPAGRVALHT